MRGPIPTRILQPAGLIFPAPLPRSATVLDAGSSRATLDIAYASIFERQVRPGFQANFDGEIGRSSLRFAHGLGGGAEIVVAPVLLFATSGFLDRIVDEFHAATGFAGGGRDDFDRDRFAMRLEAGGVTAYELEEDQVRLADLPISWVQRLRTEDADGPAIAARVTVELPTGSEGRGTGSDGIDWVGGVLLERSLGRWTLTGGIDGMVADQPSAFTRAGIDVRKLLYGSLGVEYRWNDRTSVLFQSVFQSPLTRSLTFEEIDREILDLGFGVARDLGDGTLLTVSFHEDAVAASGPDLTIYFGLSTRF